MKDGCYGNCHSDFCLYRLCFIKQRNYKRAVPGHGGALRVCFPKFSSILNFPLFFSKSWLNVVPCCCSFPIWTTFVFCLLSQLQSVLPPKPLFSLFIPRSYHTRQHHLSSYILLIPDTAYRQTTSDPYIQFHHGLCCWTGCFLSKLFFMGALWPMFTLHSCIGIKYRQCSSTSAAPGFC